MAAMNFAGFLRNEGRVPSSGSEWADRLPRAQRSAGRVYHPDILNPPPVSEVPSRLQPSPGFAEFLRNFYLPQVGL